MGELLKECLLVNLVEETGWRENWNVVASSNHFQLLQVATSLYLWSWFPKKVESDQVAQLMKIDLEDLSIFIKISIEESWGCLF